MPIGNLVELISVPFFNYFYSNVFRESDNYGPTILHIHYRYFPVLLPSYEELAILRIASSDKYSRIKELTEISPSLVTAKLEKRSFQAYISNGDPEEITLPIEFSKMYEFARNLWISLDRPVFDIAAGNSRLVFNIRSARKNLLIYSTKTSTPERYVLSLIVIPIKITRQNFDDYVSFYPNNYGISPPKFYSINCTALRLNSKGELQQIPITLVFEKENLLRYKKKISNDYFFAKLALVSTRNFGEASEPDYNIVLELTPIDLYALYVYFGSTEESKNSLVIERVIRPSIRSQLENVFGRDIYLRKQSVSKTYGLVETKMSESGIRVSMVKLSVLSKLLHLFLEGQNRTFCKDFLMDSEKIKFLTELSNNLADGSQFLPNGELMSGPLRSTISQLMKGDSEGDPTI